MVKKRLLRINKYLDDKVLVIAKHNNMSINQTLIELIQLGLLEVDKKDLSYKQLRNK